MTRARRVEDLAVLEPALVVDAARGAGHGEVRGVARALGDRLELVLVLALRGVHRGEHVSGAALRTARRGACGGAAVGRGLLLVMRRWVCGRAEAAQAVGGPAQQPRRH